METILFFIYVFFIIFAFYWIVATLLYFQGYEKPMNFMMYYLSKGYRDEIKSSAKLILSAQELHNIKVNGSQIGRAHV